MAVLPEPPGSQPQPTTSPAEKHGPPTAPPAKQPTTPRHPDPLVKNVLRVLFITAALYGVVKVNLSTDKIMIYGPLTGLGLVFVRILLPGGNNCAPQPPSKRPTTPRYSNRRVIFVLVIVASQCSSELLGNVRVTTRGLILAKRATECFVGIAPVLVWMELWKEDPAPDAAPLDKQKQGEEHTTGHPAKQPTTPRYPNRRVLLFLSVVVLFCFLELVRYFTGPNIGVLGRCARGSFLDVALLMLWWELWEEDPISEALPGPRELDGIDVC